MKWIPYLDGLRGMSIFCVIIAHLSQNMDIGEPWAHLCGPLGRIGVAIFFVISGFIITKSLTSELKNPNMLRNFYIRRAFRILPASVLYLIVYSTWFYQKQQDVPVHELLAVSMLLAGLWPVTTWFTGHYWSLCVEEQFYLGMPAFLKKYGLKKAEMLGWGVIVISPITRIALYKIFGSRYDMSIFWVVDCLAAGVVLAIRSSHQNIVMQRPLVAVATILFFALLLGYYSHQGKYGVLTVPLLGTFQALLGSILIISGIGAAERGLWWRNLLESSILVQVGKWSYSLYLFQQMFLVPRGIISEKWQSAPINLIVCFLLVPIIYFLWEVPMRNFGKKLTKEYGT